MIVTPLGLAIEIIPKSGARHIKGSSTTAVMIAQMTILQPTAKNKYAMLNYHLSNPSLLTFHLLI